MANSNLIVSKLQAMSKINYCTYWITRVNKIKLKPDLFIWISYFVFHQINTPSLFHLDEMLCLDVVAEYDTFWLLRVQRNCIKCCSVEMAPFGMNALILFGMTSLKVTPLRWIHVDATHKTWCPKICVKFFSNINSLSSYTWLSYIAFSHHRWRNNSFWVLLLLLLFPRWYLNSRFTVSYWFGDTESSSHTKNNFYRTFACNIKLMLSMLWNGIDNNKDSTYPLFPHNNRKNSRDFTELQIFIVRNHLLEINLSPENWR